MAFCPKCGTQVESTAQFCPNCGTSISTSSPQVSPPMPPPTPQAGPIYSAVDKTAIGKIKIFSLLGIVGIVLGVLVPTFSGFTSSIIIGSSAANTIAAGAATFAVVAIVAIIGFVIGVVALLQIRSAFKGLSQLDNRFSTPSWMVLGLFAALVIFIVDVILVISFVVSLPGFSLTGPTPPPPVVTSGMIATLLGIVALFGLGAIAALVGIIGIILGLWRAGERYKEDAMKIGGILYIIPLLDVVAPILVYLGASSAEKKVS